MEKSFRIDGITWNDLNMDAVYERINFASSSVGQEYLKHALMTPVFEEEPLNKRDAKAQALSRGDALVTSLQKVFQGLGKTKKVSFLDYIFRIRELKKESNLKHYILILLLLAAIAMIFVQPAVGIIALVVMIALNIGLYFKFRSGVEAYFNSMKYLVRMITAGKGILKLDMPDAFSEDMEVLREDVRIFAPLKRGSWLITNSVSGSLIDVIMDYIRMIFHVDLIKFNSMKNKAAAHEGEIQSLYDTLGEIELALCIMQFRKEAGTFCRPSFSEHTRFHATDMTHPLVEDAVANSIEVKRPVLLTGSNASGKSTFLKMVAINQIFAQTIDTCLAASLKTRFYKVISSMALTDNILGKESYFIVEIKSLKRIFDALEETVPVMAFVDEVLRGTNTAERIAASGEILKKLSHENALVFAATHDIELTKLLSDDMDNYHFSETVREDQVLFDYQLKEGPAKSRNAIRLLRAYGFDPEIVEAAEQKALRFQEKV